MTEANHTPEIEQAEEATSTRRVFMRKAGVAAFVAPVVASYLVSDLVKKAKAQENYGPGPSPF